ncbi:MAG: hypothetical protein E6G44_06340 [Actinobacteria bacterium]|nr:MAG: hypothetical protein E6G44_06340 [Actinomycetota bacterium]
MGGERTDHRRVCAGHPGRGGGGPGADRLGPVQRQAAGFLRQGHRRLDEQLLSSAVDRRKGARETRQGERGSAAVEFVLVLPLVLVMSLAIVQVGLLVKDQLVVTEAARAGAREAAVTLDDDRVRQAAIDAGATLDPTRVEVSIAREGGAGSPVTVTVDYDDAIVVPLVTWLFPDSVGLSATAVMRQETG